MAEQINPENDNAVELEEPGTQQRKRGIYILPNLFTTGSLFSGFYGIVASMNQHFILGAIAVFICLIFDSLDGRVARLINAQSAFGAQYDSLSDLLAFGVSPALLVYNWSLADLVQFGVHKIGWLTAFIFVACVAMRLAKFNTLPEDKRFFFGLPCPAAAAVLAGVVWVGSTYDLSGLPISLITMVIVLTLSFLQVSNIRYRSYKDIDLKANVRFTVLVLMMLALVCISYRPAQALFLLFVGYALTGPINGLISLKNKRQKSA
ncbi:MAG: CDP-diacylglycerol--serine O-phosphatidyltransferase [Gammaproteobacteria bacterium]|nr:CDP-diacylglycerol--serine O-phosphatidyltransferase [Gammaproteobacteria bacterium]